MIRVLAALTACLALFASPAHAADDIWKRADTRHFTIYSTGDEDDLTAFARDLERFDGLLRFWYDKPDRPGKTRSPSTCSTGRAVSRSCSVRAAWRAIIHPTSKGPMRSPIAVAAGGAA